MPKKRACSAPRRPGRRGAATAIPPAKRIARPIKVAHLPHEERIPVLAPTVPREPTRDVETPRTVVLPPKELAAYLLGSTSRLVRMYHELFWFQASLGGGVETNVGIALDELDEARLALAEETPRDLSHGLRQAIADYRQLNRQLLLEWVEYGRPQGVGSRSPHVPGTDQWRQLCTQSDSALDESYPLRLLYDLGVAVGSYDLDLWRLVTADGQTGDLDRLPDIGPLIRRILPLADDVLDRVPLLRSYTQFAPVLRTSGQAAFLESLFDSEFDTWGHWSDAVDFPAVSRMVRVLNTTIREGLDGRGQVIEASLLESLESENDRPGRPAGAVRTVGPHWVKDTRRGGGVLYCDGQVERKVAPQARIIIQLLAAFEVQGWPSRIQSPFAEPGKKHDDPHKTTNVCKSININLNILKFHGDGEGTGFAWSRNEQPSS